MFDIQFFLSSIFYIFIILEDKKLNKLTLIILNNLIMNQETFDTESDDALYNALCKLVEDSKKRKLAEKERLAEEEKLTEEKRLDGGDKALLVKFYQCEDLPSILKFIKKWSDLITQDDFNRILYMIYSVVMCGCYCDAKFPIDTCYDRKEGAEACEGHLRNYKLCEEIFELMIEINPEFSVNCEDEEIEGIIRNWFEELAMELTQL